MANKFLARDQGSTVKTLIRRDQPISANLNCYLLKNGKSLMLEKAILRAKLKFRIFHEKVKKAIKQAKTSLS